MTLTATQESIQSTAEQFDEASPPLERPPILRQPFTINDSTVAPQNAALAFAESSFPEGGFVAWQQMGRSFFLGGIYCGAVSFKRAGSHFQTAWGIVQDALLQTGVAGAALLGLVGSLGPGLEVLLAIPASTFSVKVGINQASALGSLLCGLGPLLASFTTQNYAGLLLTQGFLFGLGCALCFNALASLPSQYFRKRRGLATGILFGSGGLGAATMSLSLSALIKRVGLEWTLRIFGLATIACCLPASWFLKARFTGAGAGKLDFGLFKNVQFSLLFVSGLIGNLPIFVAPFMLPSFMRTLGYSKETSAWLLAVYSVASAAGRVIIGILSDTLLGPLNSILITQILLSLSLLVVWTLSRDLTPMVVFAILNGLASGAYFSMTSPVVAAMFRSSPVQMTLSLTVTGWCVGNLSGSPISGALLEASASGEPKREDYLGVMLFAGALSAVSALLLLIMRFRADRKLLKKL